MAKNLTLLFAFTVFIGLGVRSQSKQKIDSLLNIASTCTVDTNLVNVYEQITKLYIKTQLDSAVVYGQKMLHVSEKLGYNKGVAMGNIWLIEAYYMLGENDSALCYFKKANEAIKKTGKSSLLAQSIQVIANVYTMSNKLDSAIVLYKEALKIHETNNDILSASKVMLYMAWLYGQSGEYASAEKYLYKAKLNFNSLNNTIWLMETEKSFASLYSGQNKHDSAVLVCNRVIKYYKSVNNYVALIESLAILGGIYMELEDYDKALEIHKKCLKYGNIVNDQIGLAITKMDIGNVYLHIEKYDSVLVYLDSSREIFRKTNSMRPLTFNLFLTAFYHMQTNQLEKSKERYLEAYNIAKSNRIKHYIKEAAESLSGVYEKLHDYKNALKYSKIFKIQYDSLINEDNIREQTIAQEGYKYKLKLVSKEKEIGIEKQKINYVIIIGVAILLILIFIVFYRMKLHKTKLLQVKQESRIKVQNAKLQTQKDERKRVANILHDNLAHVILDTYSKVIGLIETTKDAKPRQMLLQIEESLNFMNKLAKVASYELEFSFVLENNLVDQFKKYIGRVQHSYPAKINLQHSEKSQFDNLPDEVKINVFSVFQEMLGNAVKYSKAQHISISLFIDDGQTVLQVEDDGIGFNYDEERHGQGFPNMMERAVKLDGTFTYESEKGFGTKLKFVV
jgi:signal transduction histidine kinase